MSPTYRTSPPCLHEDRLPGRWRSGYCASTKYGLVAGGSNLGAGGYVQKASAPEHPALRLDAQACAGTYPDIHVLVRIDWVRWVHHSVRMYAVRDGVQTRSAQCSARERRIVYPRHIRMYPRLSGVVGVGRSPPGQLLPAARGDPRRPDGPPCRRRGSPGAHRPHRAGQRPLAGASGSSRSPPPTPPHIPQPEPLPSPGDRELAPLVGLEGRHLNQRVSPRPRRVKNCAARAVARRVARRAHVVLDEATRPAPYEVSPIPTGRGPTRGAAARKRRRTGTPTWP
eukprot:1188750-Prorocentrum_minimum.AAC.1